MMHSRRTFLKSSSVAAGTLAGELAGVQSLWAQIGTAPPTERAIQTPLLAVGFEESGNTQGFPIILLHGFPDDVRAWDEVGAALAKAGHRVLVPYLRGYGRTRIRDVAAPRMAEQAAIGQDVIDFADA